MRRDSASSQPFQLTVTAKRMRELSSTMLPVFPICNCEGYIRIRIMINKSKSSNHIVNVLIATVLAIALAIFSLSPAPPISHVATVNDPQFCMAPLCCKDFSKSPQVPQSMTRKNKVCVAHTLNLNQAVWVLHPRK